MLEMLYMFVYMRVGVFSKLRTRLRESLQYHTHIIYIYIFLTRLTQSKYVEKRRKIFTKFNKYSENFTEQRSI